MLHCNETAGDHPRRRPTPSSASMPARRCAPTAYGRRAAELARLTALGLPVPPGVALSFDCVAALAAGGPMPDAAARPRARPAAGAALQPRGARLGRRRARSSTSAPARAASTLLAAADRRPRRARACYLPLHRRASPTPCTASTPRTSRRWPAAASARHRARRRGAPRPARRHARALRGGDRRAPGRRTRPSSSRPPPGRWRAPGTRPRRASCARPRARRPTPASASSSSSMALGVGPGVSGSGQVQLVDGRTGAPGCIGELPPAGQGSRPPASAPATARGRSTALASLEELARGARRARPPRRAPPPASATPAGSSSPSRTARSPIVDAVPVRRNARAAVRIAVDLANAGAITRDEALLRIEPRSLIEHLHPQIDPAAPRDVFGTGLAASPGAATGRIVFTAEAAQAAAAQDEATILVRARDQPRGHPRHARRARRPDRARRHDQPRRGDRPRPRPALRRRRRRAPPRPRRAHADHARTAASSARAR